MRTAPVPSWVKRWWSLGEMPVFRTIDKGGKIGATKPAGD
jgi:hypothetical protein